MRSIEENRALIQAFWRDLESRDYDKVGSYFSEEGLYEDVPTPDDGARGPAAISARLKVGLEPIEHYVHHTHQIVIEGDTIITEHTEEWHWDKDHQVALPFVSIHKVNAQGQLTAWRDYWDMPTLLGAAPQWWLDHIMKQAENVGLR